MGALCLRLSVGSSRRGGFWRRWDWRTLTCMASWMDLWFSSASSICTPVARRGAVLCARCQRIGRGVAIRRKRTLDLRIVVDVSMQLFDSSGCINTLNGYAKKFFL